MNVCPVKRSNIVRSCNRAYMEGAYMSSEIKNTQCRKWLIEINNPIEHGYTREVIKNKLESLSTLKYYCISDEIGGQTSCPHVHIFVIYENPKLFSTMNKKFHGCHLDMPNGTNSQCRDYVFKEGKWYDSEKGVTNLRDTHEEYGDLPIDHLGTRNDLAQLIEMIKDGKSTMEIIDSNPNYVKDIDLIDKYRVLYHMNQFKDTWRDVKTTYIFGQTGTGKSKYVMEKYGYSNVYRVTDYEHPFDSYAGEDVLLFEEFRSSLRITDMLTYLDGYPVTLKARYFNKSACFTKVYFATNIDLLDQYRTVQIEETETWIAFLRRINEVSIISLDGVATFPIDVYVHDEWRKVNIFDIVPFD